MNIHIFKLKYFILALSLSLLSCQEDVREVTLYTKGQILEATSTKLDIKYGETVTYNESATKVRAVKWTFEGGSPGTSLEPNVVVKYAVGGTYTATLEVTHTDNVVEKRTFIVQVEKAPPVPPTPPIDGLKIYADNDNFTDKPVAVNLTWVIGTNFVATKFPNGGFEGGYSSLTLPNPVVNTYAHAYLSFTATQDITAYAYYNLAIRTTSNAKMRIRMNDSSGAQGYVLLDGTNPYGLIRDGDWHMVKIPIADIKKQNPALKFNLIKDILVLRTIDGDDVAKLNNCTWDIDNVYLSR
ncbi:PKD domain-containing protein [Flavobacterium sp. WC2509]|uniref:PKD domain-containing protein n=1 Tax=Flavobacterium sp. WC2509 TaxID=3461406 RepID=UPI004043CCC2